MKKYEIYLPLKYNDGREIEAAKIKQIREELIAVFGALTVSSQSSGDTSTPYAAPQTDRYLDHRAEYPDDLNQGHRHFPRFLSPGRAESYRRFTFRNRPKSLCRPSRVRRGHPAA
jgi:hypothetical protein